MKYKVSVGYHVKVEAEDERNAVEEGHAALCKEFSLTEYQLAFCLYKVEKVEGERGGERSVSHTKREARK